MYTQSPVILDSLLARLRRNVNAWRTGTATPNTLDEMARDFLELDQWIVDYGEYPTDWSDPATCGDCGELISGAGGCCEFCLPLHEDDEST